jgi:RNA polymerase sigma factor (TIGR02999 family)
MSDVTRILNAIEQGDTRAADEQKMSQERPGQTLQATALVHEAYIRLVAEEAQDWKSRRHFFRAAAEAMRRILIDNARRKKSLKHGGEHQKIDVDEAILKRDDGLSVDDLLALDEALVRLSADEEIRAEVVKLRYFTGLSVGQTADILGISPTTVKRYWAYARAWLLREIG